MPAHVDEETPLLGRQDGARERMGEAERRPSTDSVSNEKEKEQRDWLSAGNATSGVFNLCSATLGAGQLQIPYAMIEGGIIPGVLLLLLGAVSTFFSFRFIALCASEHGATSLEGIARQAFGVTVQRLLQAGIILFSLGIAIMFMTRAGDLLEAGLQGTTTRTHALSIYGVLCFFMASARQMYTIRTISICSLLSVLYLVALTVGHCVWHFTLEEKSESYYKETNSNLLFGTFSGGLQTFPMIFYAFAAQLSVPAILEGMNQEYKLKKRLRRVMRKRKRIARALAITRAQSSVLDELITSSTHHKPANPAKPLGKSSMMGSSNDLSNMSFRKLERLNNFSIGDLAKAPLETLTKEQFDALHKHHETTLDRRQIRLLSKLPLETLSPVELQALGELPLEDFSHIMLHYAAANPIDALEVERADDSSPSLRRQIMEHRQEKWEDTHGEARMEQQLSSEHFNSPSAPGSPNHNLGMTPGMKTKSFDKVAGVAVLVCTLVDLLVGVFGAVEFGENTNDNILRNYALHYDIGSLWMVFAYASFLFHISTVLPLIFFPCRIAILGIIFGHEEDAFIMDLEQRIISGSLRDEEQLQAGKRIFWFHRASEVITMIYVSLVVIITCKSEHSIKTSFELFRGFGFAFMCFGFPAVAAIKMGLVQDSMVDVAGAALLIVVSIVAAGFWTYAAIEDDLVPSGDE